MDSIADIAATVGPRHVRVDKSLTISQMMLVSRSAFVVSAVAALVGLRRRSYLIHDRANERTWDAVSFFATQRRTPLYLTNFDSRATYEMVRVASEQGWRVLYVLPETVESPDPSATLSTEAGSRYVVTNSVAALS